MDEQIKTPGNSQTDVRKIVNLSKHAQEYFVGKRVMTPHDMRDELTGMIEAFGSQKIVAIELGISQGYLGDLLHGHRDFSVTIARRMGFERVTVFVR